MSDHFFLHRAPCRAAAQVSCALVSCALVALFALSLVALAGCTDDAPPPTPREPRPVRVVEAVRSGDATVHQFSGRVAAPVRTRLSFRVPGRIVRLPIEIGSVLSAGDLIGALETTDLALQVEQAEAARAGAAARAREANARYERVAALYATDSAPRGELDAALSGIESARSAVRGAEQALELARRARGYARLEAPARGLVADLLAEVGENVQAGQPIAAFASIDTPFEVEWTVPETLIGAVRPGIAVDVRFPALGGAVLRALISEVGATPRLGASTFPVVAVFGAPDERLRPGMAAEVRLELPRAGSTSDGGSTAAGAASEVVLVPAHAVTGDARGRYVFVVEPRDRAAHPSADTASDTNADTSDPTSTDELRIVRRRPVEIGVLRPDGLEIVSGLDGGETVVSAGVTRLDDGQTVRLLRGDPLGELPSPRLGSDDPASGETP